jgi:D-alanyl-D-alanine dipeptidase
MEYFLMNIIHLLITAPRSMLNLRLNLLLCALAAMAVPAHASPPVAMLVDAGTVVPGLMTDMRYAGSHNFVGRPIDGYRAPRCLLTQSAADALAKVARDVATRGLVIKVFDCYRPARAVADFGRWARDPSAQAA